MDLCCPITVNCFIAMMHITATMSQQTSIIAKRLSFMFSLTFITEVMMPTITTVKMMIMLTLTVLTNYIIAVIIKRH